LEPLEDRCLLSYGIIDLGPTWTRNLYAVNNAGQIAGQTSHALRVQYGIPTDLGTLGGIDSTAYGLNNPGQVVGSAQNPSGVWQAFVWDGTLGMRAIGPYRAYGVNDSGQVVGTNATDSYQTKHAWYWDASGGLEDLGTLGGTNSRASAISGAGQIVGWRETWSNISPSALRSVQGFVLDHASGSVTLLAPLAGFGSSSEALDINNAEQILGTSGVVAVVGPYGATAYKADRACLWQNGAVTDLGMASASAINNLGQVVGGQYLWQDGVLTNLNTLLNPALGWTVTKALDINDNGQIVGQGTFNGAPHWFLMGPADPAQVFSFTVSGPSQLTAGTPASFTVTATNGDGTTATGYTGTIHFTCSDPRAVLPADYTFTAADAGVHNFSPTLITANGPAQWLTVGDTAAPVLWGTETGMVVSPATAARLAITGPSGVAAGSLFSITVTAYDAYGNVATGYTGTIAFKSSDPTAALPANYTFTAADKGVHTFTGLKLRKKGTQTITVTDTVFGSLFCSVTLQVL
jgi:probable HAF family extracellular repeat protein